MKKIVIFILSFVIILSSVTFLGCKDSTNSSENSLDSSNNNEDINTPSGSSNTIMESKYLESKDYYDGILRYLFGEYSQLLFLNKETLSSLSYQKHLSYYKMVKFKEVVILQLSNNRGFYPLVFKGSFNEFVNNFKSNTYIDYYEYNGYVFRDYYFIHEWIYDFVIISNTYIASSDGKILHFVNMNSIKNNSVILPSGFELISGFGFANCNKEIRYLECNPELKRLGGACFFQTDLEAIKLNDGLEEIGASAFAKCKNLKQIIIPISVQQIGRYTFTDTIVYCEAESKPSGWHENFAVENAKVYYANEWHYDSNGKPVLNETETEII